MFSPMKELPGKADFKKNDVLVIFGELFSRGYANGIVDEALQNGLKVIYSTVGRREPNGQLRGLNEDELHDKGTQSIINIPLEAGFDLEKSSHGRSMVDILKPVKMSQWDKVELDFDEVEECRQLGENNFRARTTEWVNALESHISEDANVIFVHTMAGGFPRAKVVMPCANRVFKGTGERFASSKTFWESSIGRLCDISFNEVSAETLHHLIDLTSLLREKIQARGNKVNYVAYGYHGTECLVNDDYLWQSYAPYLQGWAKLRLEEIAKNAWAQDIPVTVFNVPEILTNSSSIFLGVEVALYPLIKALQKENKNNKVVASILEECQSLLNDGVSLDDIVSFTQEYLNNDLIRKWSDFEGWPQHNGPEQMQLMRDSSSQLISMHKDSKKLSTASLSEVVFRSCGRIMFNESSKPRKPIWWIGHDLVAQVAGHS